MPAIFCRTASAVLVTCLFAAPAWAATERAYIGTYTADPAQKRSNNHGEGIYLVDVDSATGALSNVRLVAKLPTELYKSLTWDRGKELAAHPRI